MLSELGSSSNLGLTETEQKVRLLMKRAQESSSSDAECINLKRFKN